MVYRWLADAVVMAHLAFVLFVVLGGLLTLRWRWFAWVHLPAAVWGTLIEVCHWGCPLTHLEQWLRLQGAEAGYVGGFIDHYIVPVLYPAGLTRAWQYVLGGFVVGWNLFVYATVFIGARARRR